ncbi:aspartyl-phosphate phosphatase Spo0E family protein [Neobacillus cucumis]|nr:aspartyl-phosphate phosphatase Spo0E family protein [Neobacillus cucumis]MDR4948125.1 aspartyl-phosphate phosphatase Spo0E family protein [Neobacillus cucumis]
MNIIETIRRKMITVAMAEGFTSPNTIQLSQTLDKLLNLKFRASL